MNDDVTCFMQYATTNGIIVNTKKQDQYLITHAPMSLHPYKFPGSAFNRVVKLATLYNTLVDRVARSPEWLLAKLEHVRTFLVSLCITFLVSS
jgi:hypothetical protein